MRKGYVAVSDEIQDLIRCEIKRTGYGPQRVLKGNVQAKRIGLTSGTIYRMIGKNGIIKSAKKSHVELAVALWKDLPDKKK